MLYSYVKHGETSMGKTQESLLSQQKSANVDKPLGCPAEPKIDPRVRRTRNLIENAFRKLIAEREYSDFSVADIADEATVNRATFYLHFESKEHLAESVFKDSFRDAVIHRVHDQERVTISGLEALAQATLEFVGSFAAQCPKSAKDQEGFLNSAILEMLQRVLGRWFELDTRAIRLFNIQDPQLVLNAFSWSILGAATDWSRDSKGKEARRVAKDLVALFTKPSNPN